MFESDRGLSPTEVYPIVLTNLKHMQVVVVGGGTVGERKIAGLLAVKARVRLISPLITPRLQASVTANELEWIPRNYQTGDLTKANLVFAATNQRAVNAQVALEARALNLLCNVADQPDEGSFHLPAVCRNDKLVVAVSTGGKSPSQAKIVRNKIAEWLADRRSE
jgi:cobalt-precorrin 5A hydrolase/precorrin-3B C17-methyltransferase